MAESIIIHFDVSNICEITDCLNRNFYLQKENGWQYPSEDYSMIISSYMHYDTEYEQAEKEAIRQKLAATPNASFESEIRRSKSDEAFDRIEQFIKTELNEFNFLVDDMHHLYTKDELREVTDFLDLYRYN